MSAEKLSELSKFGGKWQKWWIGLKLPGRSSSNVHDSNGWHCYIICDDGKNTKSGDVLELVSSSWTEWQDGDIRDSDEYIIAES